MNRPRINRLGVSLALFLLAAVFAPACSGPQQNAPGNANAPSQSGPAQSAPAAPHSQSPSALPETRQATISLEGNAEPITIIRFDGAAHGMPVAFTTYYPEDFIAEAQPSGEGDEVRFVANFAGRRNDDALLSVVFLPAGISETEARHRAKAAAKSHGQKRPRANMPKRYRWSILEIDFEGRSSGEQTIVGSVALGRAGDRFYYVLMNYPREYAEGFVPRAELVLDEWRWAENGGTL